MALAAIKGDKTLAKLAEDISWDIRWQAEGKNETVIRAGTAPLQTEEVNDWLFVVQLTKQYSIFPAAHVFLADR